jgi:hypothetical protein
MDVRKFSRPLLLTLAAIALGLPPAVAADAETSVEVGRRIYMEGRLPSGDLLVGRVSNDVELPGDYVICGNCHRRSGLGSMEGNDVVPVVAGSVLYEDLVLPTSRPPAPPVQRPAYTRETLALSIRDGINSEGNEFSMLMPRYDLSDADMDALIDFLETLTTGPAPGVTETDLHLATIVTDTVPESSRKAMLDVLQTFVEQKNTETRYETKRADNGPWHKDWMFKPYRKWVLHTWELMGPSSGWQEQLAAQYAKQPVFAVMSGLAGDRWQPIHEFCEREQLPCVFPSTNLPVINESDFYTVYLSKGISLEAAVLAEYFRDMPQAAGRVMQVYRSGDPQGETAAQSLRAELGDTVESFTLPGQQDDFRRALERNDESNPRPVVAWLSDSDLDALLATTGEKERWAGLYLSGSMIAEPMALPDTLLTDSTHLVYSTALPADRARLLARSTGWFRAKRIYAADEQDVQANAYFALKVVGGAMGAIHNYFSREYFLENIEHMIDNAIYTSIYPRMSLAPEQRFVSKGGIVARFEGADSKKLVAETDWLVPGSKQ